MNNSFNINNFSDLTNFVYDEFEKMQGNFGIKNPSTSFIDFTEKSLKKYVKLYNKPLFRQAKRELILNEAFNTMPHGWIWKLFHADLWKKMKYIMKQEENKIKDKTFEIKEEQKPDIKTLVPIISQPIITESKINIDNDSY